MKTKEEIEALYGDVLKSQEIRQVKFPGMSYEDGIKYAIDWILGDCDIHPMND